MSAVRHASPSRPGGEAAGQRAAADHPPRESAAAHQPLSAKPAKAAPGRPPRPADHARLAGQTRKLQGKHYAAKYGKRRGG